VNRTTRNQRIVSLVERYTKFPGQRRPVQGAVSMFRNYPTSRTLYAFVSLVKIFAFVRNRDAKPKKPDS
jgi:hypothetical protein